MRIAVALAGGVIVAERLLVNLILMRLHQDLVSK